MEGAGAHLHVQRLEDHAALAGPEGLQGQDQVLEGLWGRAHGTPCRKWTSNKSGASKGRKYNGPCAGDASRALSGMGRGC